MLAINLCRVGRTRLSLPKPTSSSTILQRCASSSDSNSKTPNAGDDKRKHKSEKDQKKKEDQWFGRKKLIDKVDLGFKKKLDVLAEEAKSAAADKEVQIRKLTLRD